MSFAIYNEQNKKEGLIIIKGKRLTLTYKYFEMLECVLSDDKGGENACILRNH